MLLLIHSADYCNSAQQRKRGGLRRDFGLVFAGHVHLAQFYISLFRSRLHLFSNQYWIWSIVEELSTWPPSASLPSNF